MDTRKVRLAAQNEEALDALDSLWEAVHRVNDLLPEADDPDNVWADWDGLSLYWDAAHQFFPADAEQEKELVRLHRRQLEAYRVPEGMMGWLAWKWHYGIPGDD